MLDWNLRTGAVSANLHFPSSWVEYGERGETGERLTRICPACLVLVPNEEGLLKLHVAWHDRMEVI